MEIVSVNDSYLNYTGNVYAGINTLSINNGVSTTVYSGFCIDPFHWSVSGPSSNYSIVSLANAPKPPATLNAATAIDIEKLWAEYFSPTMSSPSAAGLQIAIWELVSSNAVASDGLPANEAFSIVGNDYGASADLASLATYAGPFPNLPALTGPGQDYVINGTGSNATAPDGGGTFIMLALTLSALVLARSALIKSAGRRLAPVRISASQTVQNH
jgi:hypothetical protein